jgi:hypothetical protein
MVDMKTLQITILMISLLAVQVLANCTFLAGASAQTKPSVYVGVDLSYGDVAEAKSIIDQVSSFTNLIVVGTTRITWYQDKLTETFQYAYDKGLSFMSLPPALWPGRNTEEWYANANSSWGDKLLGFYYLDEPGGKQLDRVSNFTYDSTSYEDAASQFVSGLSRNVGSPEASLYGYESYTSDYALYWFDYKSGYDTVFAEFGWNYSRQLNVALCRGAATTHNKDWGIIITWTYTNPPYIESGDELYNDMVLAYDNGAKYILVFDGNDGWTAGILRQEHLDAMQRFWNYIQTNQPKNNPASGRTAYVLPSAYGYGFRGPQDHIWGIWEADELAYNLSTSVHNLLSQYDEKLDILYDDGLQPGNNGYNQLLYWNTYDPPPTPSPPPSSTPSPSPPSSPTTTDTPPDSLPTAPIIAATVVSAAVVSVFLLAYFRKKNYQNMEAPPT